MAQPNDLSAQIARLRALAPASKNRDQVILELTSIISAMQRQLAQHQLRIGELEKRVYGDKKGD